MQTTGEALTIDDKTLHEGRVKLCEIKATCEAIRHKKDKLQVNNKPKPFYCEVKTFLTPYK